MLEIETKFKIRSEQAIRHALKRIGARFEGRQKERDIYYYPPREAKSVSAVRLRMAGNKNIFTIKKIPKNISRSKTFKIREELELFIEDKKIFQKVLGLLDFNEAFRKEKKRLLYGWNGLKISIDKLPFIGVYLELEGSKSKIVRAAKALGLNMKDAASSTYMEIFNRYKKMHKKPGLKLVFGKD